MSNKVTNLRKEDWAKWLSKSKTTHCEVFKLSPERLISEYRHEHEITRGYHGREILELLQNAADAAREGEIQGKILISLSEHGLLFANTGSPFQTQGVNSLMTANLSPKRQQKRAVIGDKGLGFRSILNWTNSPLISSGDLGIAFTHEYSASILNNLQSKYENIKKEVLKEQKHANELILPRLAFPQWIPDWPKESWNEKSLKNIAENMWEIRNNGFDTVVGMPFSKEGAYEEAKKQLGEFRSEILLFIDSIKSLKIVIDGENSSAQWLRKEYENCISITQSGRDEKKWNVYRWNGNVPEGFTDKEELAQNSYEIIIAIPERLEEIENNTIYSFFPTDVALPLPAICHATLRLDETRKHLSQTPTNRFILQQLAERLAETAENLAPNMSNLWDACAVVCPDGNIHNDLERLGFAEKLKHSATSRMIIPVLGERLRNPKDTFIAPGEIGSWLSSRLFPEIVDIKTKQQRKFCRYLGIEQMADVKIVDRLIKTERLSIEERANAIAGIIENKISDASLTSALLIDEKGDQIPEGRQAILQPGSNMPPIPDWARIRFLHPDLRKRVSQLLGTNESRELQIKMRAMGVIEYSLAALINPIIAEANRYLNKDDQEVETLLWQEALDFIFKIYQQYPDSTTRPSFPENTRLRLPTQANVHANSTELYLSKEYGFSGIIAQAMYESWAPEKLIGNINTLGLTADIDEIISFLQWTGVAKWPREIDHKPERDFVQFVSQQVQYPVKFQDRQFDSADELYSVDILGVKTIEGLNDFLKEANWEAILGWLANDPRTSAWKIKSEKNGYLSIWPKHCKYPRRSDALIPNYIHWRISRTAWLPVTDGTKLCPSDCILGERLIESLFPRPAEPSEDYALKYRLADNYPDALQAAGVIPGLAHFSREEIYRLLIDMPQRSKDGRAAKALYRWLLLNDHALYGSSSELYHRFKKTGKMWGQKNGISTYYSVSELRHVDADGFPQGLVKEICLADLGRRVGADKVERIFGVQSVERAGIRQSIVSHRKNPHNHFKSSNFERTKPFLKRLRQSQTTQADYLNALDRLELILCDSLTVKLDYEQTSTEYEAEEWEWVMVNDHIYVRCDSDVDSDLFSDTLGAALASLFRINDGDAFAKILRCDPNSRKRLLARMCGDTFVEEVEEAHEKQIRNAKYKGPIEEPQKPESLEPEINDKIEEEQEEKIDSPKIHIAEETKNELSVRELSHTPTQAQGPRKIVVRTVEGKRTSKTTHNVTDGNLCEKMAMEFEQNIEPARFPVSVAHITGYDAPGVDILSFYSKEKRNAFLNPETRDDSLIARYIEVKGRSSASAKIELKGNELKAAQHNKDKYFIYRLYKSDESTFYISILQDPMACEEALSPACIVDLDKASSTKRFLLTNQ